VVRPARAWIAGRELAPDAVAVRFDCFRFFFNQPRRGFCWCLLLIAGPSVTANGCAALTDPGEHSPGFAFVAARHRLSRFLTKDGLPGGFLGPFLAWPLGCFLGASCAPVPGCGSRIGSFAGGGGTADGPCRSGWYVRTGPPCGRPFSAPKYRGFRTDNSLLQLAVWGTTEKLEAESRAREGGPGGRTWWATAVMKTCSSAAIAGKSARLSVPSNWVSRHVADPAPPLLNGPGRGLCFHSA